jgi:death on curing protein
MLDVVWLTAIDLIQIHDDILASSGGLPGVRSFGAVESMLQRVQNVAYYEETKDFVRLAAVLGFAIVEGHVFNDGNKRTALIAVDVFCDINDYEVFALPLEFADRLVAIASGTLSLNRFSYWLRARTRER